jgi:competence protein ComEA
MILLLGSAFLWPPASLIAQGPSPDPPGLKEGPGKDTVVGICGECHDPALKITKFRKSRAEWADLITDMQNRGLMADEKDLEVVLNYLTANYGPPPDKPEKEK